VVLSTLWRGAGRRSLTLAAARDRFCQVLGVPAGQGVVGWMFRNPRRTRAGVSRPGEAGAFPGQAEVICERPGEAELRVAGDDDPGPPVRGGGVADFRRGPAEGRGVSGCSGALQLAAPLGGFPCWEAFPEVNQALVACLQGVLVERMMTPVVLAGNSGGGERDQRPDQAVRAAGGLVGRRHRDRLAAVYVRQSTAQQVQDHQESTPLQYGLAERAFGVGVGPLRVLVIDEDLGHSASGPRPGRGSSGWCRRSGWIMWASCWGIEMSRLARSGHLVPDQPVRHGVEGILPPDMEIPLHLRLAPCRHPAGL
jgi:hypothetical protein